MLNSVCTKLFTDFVLLNCSFQLLACIFIIMESSEDLDQMAHQKAAYLELQCFQKMTKAMILSPNFSLSLSLSLSLFSSLFAATKCFEAWL